MWFVIVPTVVLALILLLAWRVDRKRSRPFAAGAGEAARNARTHTQAMAQLYSNGN